MFRKVLNDKIGNLLVYLAQNISDLSMTKALKLLYIIDETSMKESGVPVTWLGYKVWEKGPVAQEIYDEIRDDVLGNNKNISLHKYIGIKTAKNPVNSTCADARYIKAKRSFDDSEFTDYEMSLIEGIVAKYKSYTVQQLIDLLHTDNSLWSQQVKKNKLDFKLQGGRSNYSIPLNDLLKSKEEKQQVYMSAYESLLFEESIAK